MPSKKTSISLDPALVARAKKRADALGFGNSFSAYLSKLVRDDINATEPREIKTAQKAARESEQGEHTVARIQSRRAKSESKT